MAVSSRITFRALTENDRDDVYDLLFNANVMKFIGPRRALTSEEAKCWFDAEIVSPSRFVVTSKKTNELIGFCGVKDIDGILDFGYFLREKFWRQGYATEACRLSLSKLAESLSLSSLEIFIANDNKGSQAVAEKLGWFKVQETVKNGESGGLYALSKHLPDSKEGC